MHKHYKIMWELFSHTIYEILGQYKDKILTYRKITSQLVLSQFTHTDRVQGNIVHGINVSKQEFQNDQKTIITIINNKIQMLIDCAISESTWLQFACIGIDLRVVY